MVVKEVWYVWDGESLIPESAVRYIDRNGHHHLPRFTIPFKHTGFGAGGEIVAYTLGETRERVACDWCNGNGWKDVFATWAGYIYRDSCGKCHARGYIWKLGEKK